MTENRKRVEITVAVQRSNRSVRVKPLPVRVVGRLPAYEGDYAINPDFTGRVLATKNHRMDDDVTINPIYVADTSNPAGGTTVFIGGEFIG